MVTEINKRRTNYDDDPKKHELGKFESCRRWQVSAVTICKQPENATPFLARSSAIISIVTCTVVL